MPTTDFGSLAVCKLRLFFVTHRQDMGPEHCSYQRPILPAPSSLSAMLFVLLIAHAAFS